MINVNDEDFLVYGFNRSGKTLVYNFLKHCVDGYNACFHDVYHDLPYDKQFIKKVATIRHPVAMFGSKLKLEGKLDISFGYDLFFHEFTLFEMYLSCLKKRLAKYNDLHVLKYENYKDNFSFLKSFFLDNYNIPTNEDNFSNFVNNFNVINVTYFIDKEMHMYDKGNVSNTEGLNTPYDVFFNENNLLKNELEAVCNSFNYAVDW
jgi:hypothetical protein